MSLDIWIVTTGVLSALSCALLGNFLVLRRMSMMGDAISHAVLPGLAVAFLITSSRSNMPMFIGAGVVGVLTALFTQWIHRVGRVEQGAAMGVVFTTLFAIGLIIIVQAADAVDLDPGCVLYGAIELVPLDTAPFLGLHIPRAVWTLSLVFLVNVLLVILFYKELKISSFDEDLATTLGLNASCMHYLLMILVAITTVASFESVGSILVIAMFIVPGATAYLLTDRLHIMIGVSLVIGIMCAVGGHIAAVRLPAWWGLPDTSTAGMMAVVGGLLFFVALIASPRHGVASKLLHRFWLSVRITREDVLGILYRIEEFQPVRNHGVVPRILRDAKQTGPVIRWLALAQLMQAGKVKKASSGIQLTSKGRVHARNLIRTHRLWESYIEKHFVIPIDHLHAPAERLEHVTDPDMQKLLLEKTTNPQKDPHGKNIP
ncbi:MAG: iron chelate uptake ABC transporter family permease subunit [Kiritimatiellae bacterium]|nr:iron chelate uptake ABC transporter family permease subunit [Kiritimatiellia bacterium]